jgi:hypothetical protein
MLDQNDYWQAWRIDIAGGLKRAKVNGLGAIGMLSV